MIYPVNGKARYSAPDITCPYRRCCFYQACSGEDPHREDWAYRKLLAMRWCIKSRLSAGGLIHFLGPPLPASLDQHSVRYAEKPSCDHISHQQNRKHENERSGDYPEEAVAMIVHTCESYEVHAKVPS